MIPTIGWSAFALKQHTPNSGNSYTTLKPSEVVAIVHDHWALRTPGQGENGLERKVVVPINLRHRPYFYTPFVDLTPDLPVRALITRRQDGEDFYVETYVSPSECAAKGIELKRRPVKKVSIVLYAADVLTENGGERSTDWVGVPCGRVQYLCRDWEIVCLLCSDQDNEPMVPLSMARNYLQKPGGTFTDYSAKDFAEAIYYHSTHRGIRVREY
jgi:hypothetical protein